MFYGGIAGVIVCLLVLVIALGVFSRQRKKKLKSIMESL